MKNKSKEEINKTIKELSSDINTDCNELAIILAAGHGKRIKSQRSKMLHTIWGIPTVERVFNASKKGIENLNTIIVVGIKANDVIEVIGKRENNLFAYQEVQNGTGHAVQVALDKIKDKDFNGIVYVLPGDMGLIDKETMQNFRNNFKESNSDMMVLTGIYEGDPAENSYGRIIRVKAEDKNGNSSGEDEGKVIEIMENKDIHALDDNKPYEVQYKEKTYSYTKKELIENNEFNSGVYAFKYDKLTELINSISNENAQGEIYITDLIFLFNNKGYTVGAVSPEQQYVVMGFNNKSVLKEMEKIARTKIYDKIKDIIEIDDPDDFYIHESVVDDIIELDKKNKPLDISIGKGVQINEGAKLNYNLTLKKNVEVSGNVHFGKNVTVSQSVILSTYPEQVFKIGDYTEILWGDIIKGNITIGENCRIESGVNMTGSDEFPLRIGKNVLIKGTSYIFGSNLEDDVRIEHSVIIKKKVKKKTDKDGNIIPVKFYVPEPEGQNAIEEI